MRSFLLLCVALSCALADDSASELAWKVCKGTNAYALVELKTIQDVNRKIEYLKDSTAKSEELASCFGHSLDDLKELLTDSQLIGDVCSKETYDKLRTFHLNYIHYYHPELEKDELKKKKKVELEKIPIALKNYFIIFVKRITAICKVSIRDKLDYYEGKKNLGWLDLHTLFERFKQLMPAEASITPKFNDLEILDSNLSAKEKFYMKVPYGDIVIRVKDACIQKLKPIYEEVFAPVIRLNNLGYFDHSKDKISKQSITFWSYVIHWCEMLEDVELFSDLQSSKRKFVTAADVPFDVQPITMEGPIIKVEHKAIKMEEILWLKEADIESELRLFKNDLKAMIARKSSLFDRLKSKLEGLKLFSFKSI